jgi:hypothetical protein
VNIEGKNSTRERRKTKREIEEEEMNKKWDEKIHSFYPLHLMTFEIEPKQTMEFYFDLEVVPNKFMVAFYVHDEESKISFDISYIGINLYQNWNKNKLYHEVNVTMATSFTFSLRNSRVIKVNTRILRKIKLHSV